MTRAQWLILGCAFAASMVALYRVNDVRIRLGMNAAYTGKPTGSTT